jgi:hypothetical protein
MYNSPYKKFVAGSVIGVTFLGLGMLSGDLDSSLDLDDATFANVAFAKTEDTTVVACGKTYWQEFSSFLQSVVGHHGFGENFTEYFKDIFGRNRCQAYDVLMLDKQQEKAQKQIQEAYLNCKKEKIPALIKAYYALDAEIYYVRHIVKTSFFNWKGLAPAGLGYANIEDEEEVKRMAGEYLEDGSKLYNEMSEKFLDKFENSDEFGTLFDSLEVKYSERKYSYVACLEEGVGWDKVKEKFQEFINDWGGVKEAGEDFVSGSKEEYHRAKRSAVDSFPDSFESFLGNTFGAKLNNVSPKKELANIWEDVKKNMIGKPSPDLSDVVNRSSSEETRYKRDIDRASLEAKYTALYLDTTDAAMLEILAALDELRGTINETMVYLNGVYDCTNKMILHQCGGK